MGIVQDPKMCIGDKVIFPSVYSTGSTVDANSIAGAKNLFLTATTAFVSGDRVIVGRGTDREEEFIVDSVDPGVKLVSLTNLVNNHTIDESTIIDEIFDTGSTLDAEAVAAQAVVPVTATTNFSEGDHVILDRGNADEEEGIILSIQSGVSITLTTVLVNTQANGHVVEIITRGFSGQKVLAVAATTDFIAGETITIDSGNAGEEDAVIDSINAGVSITLVENLTNTHATGVAVAQIGLAKIAELCMASLSTVLRVADYKYMTIFLPSDWTTGAITFLGCDTPDGIFLQIVNGDDVSETTIASVAASKCISLNGEIREVILGAAFIKFRSGIMATPVDQGKGNVCVRVVLKR